MKISLTGGAGYIGSHTAVELAKAGHEIIIGDNCYVSFSEKDMLGLKQQHIGRSVHEQPKLVGRKIRT